MEKVSFDIPVLVVDVESDVNQGLVSQYNIQSVPTVLLCTQSSPFVQADVIELHGATEDVKSKIEEFRRSYVAETGTGKAEGEGSFSYARYYGTTKTSVGTPVDRSREEPGESKGD